MSRQAGVASRWVRQRRFEMPLGDAIA